MLVDDAVHRGQPQAGALARLLGGEERLEDPLAGGLVHAAAGVPDREQDPVAARTGGAAGADFAISTRSSISSSSIQCSSSINFFFISVTMTYPPPNVNALKYSVEKNTFRIFVHFSFMLSSHFCARFFACPLLLFVSNIVQPLVIVLIIPFLVI